MLVAALVDFLALELGGHSWKVLSMDLISMVKAPLGEAAGRLSFPISWALPQVNKQRKGVTAAHHGCSHDKVETITVMYRNNKTYMAEASPRHHPSEQNILI